MDAKKKFQTVLDDILHFQQLRSRCQVGEYDYVMYSNMLDERVVYLEKYYREINQRNSEKTSS